MTFDGSLALLCRSVIGARTFVPTPFGRRLAEATLGSIAPASARDPL